MIKLYTRGDIIELLRIEPKRFDYAVLKIGISQKKVIDYITHYTIQDMIDVYKFINKKRWIILNSKINYKQMEL